MIQLPYQFDDIDNICGTDVGDVVGYVDSNNNIVLTGLLSNGTYSIKYEMKDGSLVNIGDMELNETTPNEPTKFTNLADPTSADWQEGYRLSLSSGNSSALTGHTATNFVPCKMGDVLRVKGMIMTGYITGLTDASDTAKIISYNSSKAKISGLYGLTRSGNAEDYGLKLVEDGDVKTYTVLLNNNDEQKTTSSCAYIRIDGALMNGYTKNDVVITINEEIV